MNGFFVAAAVIAACFVIGSISPNDAYAQTGAAAMKQMQDTQRAAQKKAREAKSTPPDQTKEKSDTAPAPASAAQ